MRHPEATIVWLRDGKNIFPHAILHGDTDMVTAGWVCFTSTSCREVVIAFLPTNECNATKVITQATRSRISAALGRDDLVPVQLIRAESTPLAEELSFQEFRKKWQPPKCIYSTLSGVGESTPEREESIEEFQANGGVFTVFEA